MKKILVYGSAEFGQVVNQVVLQCGHQFVGFIDDSNTGEEFLGRLPEISKNFPPHSYEIVFAIGYKHLHARQTLFRKIQALGYRTPFLIHPTFPNNKKIFRL